MRNAYGQFVRDGPVGCGSIAFPIQVIEGLRADFPTVVKIDDRATFGLDESVVGGRLMPFQSERGNPSADPNAERCVLDREKLKQLEALLGKQKYVSFIERFKRTLGMHVAAIIADTTGPADKGGHAHKIVGLAGTVGFQEISEQSLSLERAVNENVDDLHPFIELVRAAATRANAVLETL